MRVNGHVIEGGHIKKWKEKNSEPISRRDMLKGSAFSLAGGIAGSIGAACSTTPSAKAKTTSKAPPLPWKWVELDPMEAGIRAYRHYHSDSG